MSVAANRYAKALIDALSLDRAQVGDEQLRSFAALLDEEPESKKLLENPAIAGARREAWLTEIGNALGFDRIIGNFVRILVERRRLDLLDQIIAAYERLLDQRMDVVRALVTAAQPLDNNQRRDLTSKLEMVTGKRVRMEMRVDPSLIGGVVARVNGTIYDGSVRQQLHAFKRRLVEE
jgi:F-type H+-transporting ATPase subunit delta